MKKIQLLNPADGRIIKQIDPKSTTDVENALKIARNAFKSWKETTLEERLNHLIKGQNWLLDNIDDIVDSISLNNGKPKVEALAADVAPVIQSISYYKKNAKKYLKNESVSLFDVLPNKKAYIQYGPLGVIGIISPWNYPFSIPMGEIIASLVAGNCVIIKPSEVTGLVSEQIQNFINACELPSGVFQLLEGFGSVGAALAASPVDRIIFTGSVATGRKVMQAAAENLTPVSLELGGKDPSIIFEDVDIDIATSGILAGAFYNAGQTCTSVERMIIHESIEENFLKALSEKIEKLRLGPSKDFDNDVGPITYPHQKTVIKDQLDEYLSRSQNQQELTKIEPYDGESSFIKPKLLKGKSSLKCWQEETFGPTLVYLTFKSEEEAINLANDTPFGLGAVIWSKNLSRAKKVASKLYVGTVVINDAPYTNALAALPWGGPKHSGIGKVHGKEGLRELCLTKVVTYDIQGQVKQFWWYPYSKNQYEMLKMFCKFSISGTISKIFMVFGLIRSVIRIGPRL